MKNVRENTVSITGFVVRDAEIRQLSNGYTVARFSINISEKRKNRDGQENWVSAFLDVEALRKEDRYADFELAKAKNLVTLTGYLQPQEWTDKEGNRRNKVVIAASKIATPKTQPDNPPRQAEGITATAPATTAQAPCSQSAPQPAEAPQEEMPF